MKNFSFYQPTSAEAAVGLLEGTWGKTELLAGGTDLLDLQKEYIAQPDKVVSLSGIKDFDKIAISKSEPPSMVIGAGVKLATLGDDPTVKKYATALATAAGEIGGPQIRNMGSLGGSLCQRNRCWYFRDEHVNCLLKGGDKCFALDGDNRYHAVFTQGHKCVIVHPSTTAPALIALGATAEVLGPKGKRTVDVAKLFQAPSSGSQREHTLAPNEVLLSVSVTGVKDGKSASYEVRHKQSYDWPLVQAAVAFVGSGSKPTGVKIVLGHVAPTPIIAEEAAKMIEGKEITEATAEAAGKEAAKGAKPLAMNGYKIKLIEVAVKRALLTAAGAKKYWET